MHGISLKRTKKWNIVRYVRRIVLLFSFSFYSSKQRSSFSRSFNSLAAARGFYSRSDFIYEKFQFTGAATWRVLLIEWTLLFSSQIKYLTFWKIYRKQSDLRN